MSSKHNIKNIFDWLNHMTYSKTPSSEFTEEDWDKFNSYMVNRFVSMDKNYVELANYVQITPYESKEQLYNIYKEYLPKKKMFFKYIKSTNKAKSKDLLSNVSQFMECSVREADQYVNILKKKDLVQILEMQGLEDKEIKKLLK